VILVLLVVSVAMLVEILPLSFLKDTTEPVGEFAKRPAYNALQLEVGLFIREAATTATRRYPAFRAETERLATTRWRSESVYDHPFPVGSKRTGPDLAAVGGRYSTMALLPTSTTPRDVVPESNMPAYPWLSKAQASGADTAAKMRRSTPWSASPARSACSTPGRRCRRPRRGRGQDRGRGRRGLSAGPGLALASQ